MKRLMITVLLVGFLVGCGNTPKPPEVVIKQVTVADLMPKPSPFAMQPPEHKAVIRQGSNYAEASKVVVSNNLIAQENESKLKILQDWINRAFKE